MQANEALGDESSDGKVCVHEASPSCENDQIGRKPVGQGVVPVHTLTHAPHLLRGAVAGDEIGRALLSRQRGPDFKGPRLAWLQLVVVGRRIQVLGELP